MIITLKKFTLIVQHITTVSNKTERTKWQQCTSM